MEFLIEKFKSFSLVKKAISIVVVLLIIGVVIDRIKSPEKSVPTNPTSAITETAKETKVIPTEEETTEAVTYSELTECGITFSIPSTMKYSPNISENYYDYKGIDRAGFRVLEGKEAISDSSFISNKEKLVEIVDKDVQPMLNGCQRTYAEYFKADGLNAIRCKYTGLDDGETSNVEEILINNPDNGGYILVWTMFYESNRDEYYPIFEEILKSVSVDTTVTTKKAASTAVRTGIDPEFKKYWDSYEKCMDDYIRLMKDPDAIGTLEYLTVVADYASWSSKVNNYDDSSCTEEELDYMLAVENRVAQKLLSASLSE